MHLRKSLNALVVALVVLGALGASASAGTTNHKPAKKKPLCALGSDLTLHNCRPNPLYGASACQSLAPAVQSLVGGPVTERPNFTTATSEISCVFQPGTVQVSVFNESQIAPWLKRHYRGKGTAPTVAQASTFSNILQRARAWAAAPLSALQASSQNPATTIPGGSFAPADVCTAYTGDFVQTVVPFDQPTMLSGLGGSAFAWDACATAAALPACPTGVSTLAAPCSQNLAWATRVMVKKGRATYQVIAHHPQLSVSDDQIVALIKTLMAKYR